MEDRYGIGSLKGEQGFALTTEASDVSGTLVLDEVLMDLDIPEGDQDQASTLAELLLERSLSSRPDSRMEECDVEDRVSCRHYVPILIT